MKLENNIKNFWVAAFFIFLLDQATKIWAMNFLPLEEEFLLNHYFSFQRIFNEATVLLDYNLPFGMSINIFRCIWLLVALILSCSIYWVLKQPVLKNLNIETEFAKTGLFFLLGSTWGNAFDRIFRSDGVIDFIRLNFLNNSIPILNIADIMLYIGEFCIIVTWIIIIFKSFHGFIYKIYKITK
jgi:lipoprotein signal peptidase